MGLLNNPLREAHQHPMRHRHQNARECSKKSVHKAAHGLVDPDGAHRCLARAAYMEYVSANAAKSGTSVSPKVGNTARTSLAAFSTFPK